MDDLELRVDALYAGPPGDFTAGRDALVKELRAAGDRDAAARVGALRRPTKLAAELNRLAREEPDAMAATIAAEEALAAAQRAVLDGRSSADELRAATEAEVAAVAALSDDLAVRAALRAAARRDEEREELRRGRLSRDPEPDLGAGLLGGAAPPPPAPRPARPAPGDELAARRVDRARAARRAAREEARGLSAAAARDAAEAQERLAAARARREEAEAARDGAAAAAERLREELAEAERRTAALASAAAESAAAEGRAADEASEAARLVEEAERAVGLLEDGGEGR